MLLKAASFFICAISLTCSFRSFSQFSFEYSNTIPVKIGTDTLQNGWGGGLNYAQFSDFDYDFDGDADLFVFDRSSDNIRVFTQEDAGGKHYELANNAKVHFPPDLKYRTTLVDYDADGRKDIFTYGIGGLKVYRNTGDLANGLQWELYLESVYTQLPSSYTTLYVSSSDIPAIVDVDGDGDTDVLSFHIGGSHVNYHQNQSMELYGIPDSLIFVLKNECWGKFGESAQNNSVVLNDPSYPCVGGEISNPEGSENMHRSVHVGSTLLALDYDNSGVMDLVLGDGSYNNLCLLLNSGSTVNADSPMISVDYAFPSNTTPVDLNSFPASFYLDVDFDGIRDLLVCPNAVNVSLNERSVYFYKNVGSDVLPTFVYVTDNFLQAQMIDHGAGSIPVFFDYNEDGLEDLVVANYYRYKPVSDKESTIALYLNTGTLSDPVFTFVDDDFLNLAAQGFSLRSVPTFGDLDNDGDDDLFLGRMDGTLVYYENTSVGSGAVFSTPVSNYTDNNSVVISTSAYCHPQLFDLNNDGLLDLILGKKNGNVAYYRNTGTLTVPNFELVNDLLGGIDVSLTTPDGFAAPHFFRNNGQTVCFLGSIDGHLNYYSDIDGNLSPGASFTLISDNLATIDVDAYSSCWVNDIDNDGAYNLFVGQDLGGLLHFEHDPNSPVAIEESYSHPNVAVYPNPAHHSITIAIHQLHGKTFTLFDLNGKQLMSDTLNGNKTIVDIHHLNQGVYVLQIEMEGQQCTKRI